MLPTRPHLAVKLAPTTRPPRLQFDRKRGLTTTCCARTTLCHKFCGFLAVTCKCGQALELALELPGLGCASTEFAIYRDILTTPYQLSRGFLNLCRRRCYGQRLLHSNPHRHSCSYHGTGRGFGAVRSAPGPTVATTGAIVEPS